MSARPVQPIADQLDIWCEQERRRIAGHVNLLRSIVAEWEPRPAPRRRR